MSEGRKTQILLLDDRHLDILIQPKLFAHELLDLVSSHYNLKEKEYFGLAYKDETGHLHWLQLDRRVLEHDLPKKSRPLQLFFSIRFYIESISYLRDRVTVELFYEQAKQSLHKGHLDCDSETVFDLAAHCLQATHGDFYDEDIGRRQLKKLPVLPTHALQEHPSITYCEDEVIAQYKKLDGQTRGGAIVSYMTIVESIPTYGIHFYEVKDKSSLPWWLGLSHKGISIYDHNDKRTPRRVFAWKQLENLYFRDKKFSIEVHDPKRVVHALSSFNLYEDAIQEPLEDFDDLSDAISDPTTQVSVSRRTFGPGNVNVHAWFTSNASLTKCIWSMAVSQHQFYLDRKQTKSQLPQVRSLTEIATELCHSNNSLNSSAPNSISRTNSSVSLTNLSLSTNNSAPPLSVDDLESSSTAQKDMHSALKERKHALEELMKKKTELLKALCLQEGSLTGVLPQETPLNPGEAAPQIRKRVGTSFSLSPELLNTSQEDAVAALELDYDIQDKIVKAAHRLSQDPTVTRTVRKQRRQSYHRAHSKLKDIERKLHSHGLRSSLLAGSTEDLSEDSREFLDADEFQSPVNSPAGGRHGNRTQYLRRHHSNRLPASSAPSHHQQNSQHIYGNQPQAESYESSSTPPFPTSLTKSAPSSPQRLQRHSQQQATPVTPNQRPQYETEAPGGYVPNSVYATRTQYRNQSYPTFSSNNAVQPAAAPIQSPYQHNLYSVQNHISRRYDSTDELLSPSDGLYRRPPDPNAQYQQTQYSSPLHHRHGGSVDLLDVDLSPAKRSESQLPGDSTEDNYRTYPGHSRSFTEHNSGNSTWYVPDTSYEGMDLSGVESPQAAVTTKYQNYVEVSKPFEMSDFYKYSEKLRRQRVNESPGYHSLGRRTPSSSPYVSAEPERPISPYTASTQQVSSYHAPRPMTCDPVLPRPRSPTISSQRIV